jgi:hypothetical protein
VTRVKAYAVVGIVAAVLGGIVSAAYAMPSFTLLACPGVVLGLMAAGNTLDSNMGIIFFGNWLFYSLVFMVLAELVLFIKRARSR